MINPPTTAPWHTDLMVSPESLDAPLTWFEHGILDKTLWKVARKVPEYLDDTEGAEWLNGYDSVQAESDV